MNPALQYASTHDAPTPEVATIQTTLYDLINVINDTIGGADERLVVCIVSDLVDRGLISFIEPYVKITDRL